MNIKQIHIEKYDIGSFEKERKPYVMIRTEIIQAMTMEYSQEFLLWIFLESLPPTWIPNKSHITNHFDISDRTYERYMGWLNGAGLIEYRQNRLEDGSFGKGHLVVLDGAKFNIDAVTDGAVRISGRLINKKKSKVIHNLDDHRTAKFVGAVESPIGRTSKGKSRCSPNRQITEVRCRDVHIKTRLKTNKEKKKTNKGTVSVFSDSVSIQNHINLVLSNRGHFLEDDTVNQIVYYIGHETDYDMVVKKINIALKMVRDGKWNIPNGYKGITSKSIREKEEMETERKRIQHEEEAQAAMGIMREVGKCVYIPMAERLRQHKVAIGAN